MLGNCCVKHGSTLQSTIALSVGEAEYYAAVKGAGFGMQVKGLLSDWGYECELAVVTDSNSAIGTASRQGLGKLRHVQTRYLWVQERLLRGEFVLDKVGTKSNPADIGTKPLPRLDTERLMAIMGQDFRAGRASTAKHLVYQ